MTGCPTFSTSDAHHIKFQAQAPKRVSFAGLASDSDEAAEMVSGNDEAAEIALETDAREPRVSARLAALTANCRLLWLQQLGIGRQKNKFWRKYSNTVIS